MNSSKRTVGLCCRVDCVSGALKSSQRDLLSSSDVRGNLVTNGIRDLYRAICWLSRAIVTPQISPSDDEIVTLVARELASASCDKMCLINISLSFEQYSKTIPNISC